MSVKGSKVPDSDRSVRGPADLGDDQMSGADIDVSPQTSTKSGKHSSVEKKAASRLEAGTGEGAKSVPGAFGEPDTTGVRTGTNPGVGPNKKGKTRR
jgi:hypothetical protein